MAKTNFNQVDLLRKRRKEGFFLDPFFIDNNKYIKKGIYFGLSIIGVSFLIGTAFIFRSSYLEKKKLEIKPLVDEYDTLEIKLNKESNELKVVASFNDKLKNSIVNVSSSSALFSEISNIIPKNLQLINLNSSGNVLTLESQLSKFDSFALINGFLISLDNSEFINFSDIDLTEIKSIERDKEDLFNVVLTTKITNNYKEINQKYLKTLGSEGLSNRIDILKKFDK